jgi:hypothetical protein
LGLLLLLSRLLCLLHLPHLLGLPRPLGYWRWWMVVR